VNKCGVKCLRNPSIVLPPSLPPLPPIPASRHPRTIHNHVHGLVAREEDQQARAAGREAVELRAHSYSSLDVGNLRWDARRGRRAEGAVTLRRCALHIVVHKLGWNKGEDGMEGKGAGGA